MLSETRRLRQALLLLAVSAVVRRGCAALKHDLAFNTSVADIADALANAVIASTIDAQAAKAAAARPVVHCHTPAPPPEILEPALDKISRQKQRSHSGPQIESGPSEIKVAVHVLSSGVTPPYTPAEPLRGMAKSLAPLYGAWKYEASQTPAGSSRAEGNTPDAWITAQIIRLNAAYKQVGFSFVLTKVRRVRDVSCRSAKRCLPSN